MAALTATQTALSYLKRLLVNAGAGEELSVRIEQATDGSGKVTVGRWNAGDKQFKYEGRTVLALNKETAANLAGKTVDIDSHEGREQIVLKDA